MKPSFASLQAIAATLNKNRVAPSKVATQEEAEAMTANDATGHQWVAGEQYYRLESVDGGPFLFKEIAQ